VPGDAFPRIINSTIELDTASAFCVFPDGQACLTLAGGLAWATGGGDEPPSLLTLPG
jgi:hypothetical protein